MMPSWRPRRCFFRRNTAERDAPDVVDRFALPHGEREDLFIRLCHAMGWEYEFKYWPGIGGPGRGNRRGPYGQFTVSAAAQVITGKPVYGAGLVEFMHPGTVVVTSAYEYRSFDGPDADPGWLSREVDGICGEWLDAAYDMREWKNSKPVVGGNVGGRVPAGSDAELRLWLEAAGL